MLSESAVLMSKLWFVSESWLIQPLWLPIQSFWIPIFPADPLHSSCIQLAPHDLASHDIEPWIVICVILAWDFDLHARQRWGSCYCPWRWWWWWQCPCSNRVVMMMLMQVMVMVSDHARGLSVECDITRKWFDGLHAYIRTCMHAYIHQPYINTCVRSYAHTLQTLHTCMHTYIHTHIHERMHQTNKHTLKQRNNKLSQQQNNETTKKAHTQTNKQVNTQTSKHRRKSTQTV